MSDESKLKIDTATNRNIQRYFENKRKSVKKTFVQQLVSYINTTSKTDYKIFNKNITLRKNKLTIIFTFNLFIKNSSILFAVIES